MRRDTERPCVLDRHFLGQHEAERPGLLSGDQLGSCPEALFFFEKDLLFLTYKGRTALDLEARETEYKKKERKRILISQFLPEGVLSRIDLVNHNSISCTAIKMKKAGKK